MTGQSSAKFHVVGCDQTTFQDEGGDQEGVLMMQDDEGDPFEVAPYQADTAGGGRKWWRQMGEV